MRIFLALLIAYSLCGCAVSKQVVGPDGTQMHSINCSGTALTWGDCLEKAGKTCGSYGYDIVMRSGENPGNVATAGQYGFFASPIITREMVIRCKDTAK